GEYEDHGQDVTQADSQVQHPGQRHPHSDGDPSTDSRA
ncbi:MAG: hypothetical protein QOD31_1339, partial [Pseudonocardiales bacterium]|nr:hypothetical protein [Pseudonocardiales bacterium]